MNTTFLDLVATDLLERHNGHLENVTIVFPGKRAHLFMNEALLAQAKGAMWSPGYTSITQLFEHLSGGSTMESIPAVIHLYSIYSQLLSDKAESLDRFWGWGEIILSDFDDIDKHLVEADKLFQNALELSQMDTIEFLTPEQKAALGQFFKTFEGDRRTVIQKRFLELWNIMPELYRRFNASGEIFGTEGAMQRHVIENESLLQQLDTETEYCFAGFNMLSATERSLMKYIEKNGKAKFYWDYDEFYLKNHNAEAGDFMRQNLKDFPNEIKKLQLRTQNGSIYDNLRHNPGLTYVAASTDSMATRYIPLWLKDNLSEPERQTAIVLCDEKKLVPVLHAIPDVDGPQDINITMGYPLNTSPVYSLTMALVALQTEGWDDARKRFRYTFQKAVERHPYAPMINTQTWNRHIDPADAVALTDYLDECVLELFHQDEDILYVESIYLTHRALRQFADCMAAAFQNQKHETLKPETLRRLLRRMLASLSVPFHGEPAVGLQVMGLLETRCLDFRNILILNAEEGLMPAQQNDTSLIPNTLRTGFGLTTVRHRTAVFAYYFYRLIQRAEHVTMVYNQTNSGITHHEMSRFLRQLQAETEIPIRLISLEAGQDVDRQAIDDIPKSEEIMQQLHQIYDKTVNPQARPLSPSAMNIYLDCPMKFYLHALCGLTPKDDPEDGVDARAMGEIIHNIAQEVYTDIARHAGIKDVNTTDISTGALITADKISVYLKDKAALLQPMIDEQFQKVSDVKDFRGENVLIRSVVEQYVINLLKWDAGLKQFSILRMEDNAYLPITITNEDGSELRISTGGRIDRMDRIFTSDCSDCSVDSRESDVVRIVDYKTGAHENAPKSVDDLFQRDSHHASYWLQTFLYAIAAKRRLHISGPVRPTLFYMSKAAPSVGRYDPRLIFSRGTRNAQEVLDIADFEEEYITRLKQLISEIFNPSEPFRKCPDSSACSYCDFRSLCGR